MSSDKGKYVHIEVTPASYDTVVNSPIVSSGALVLLNPEERDFIKPDSTERTYSQALSHCDAVGALIPTADELQRLFVDATRSPAYYPNSGTIENSDMFYLHGWPHNTLQWYWARSPSTNDYKMVNMKNGEVRDTYSSDPNLVACKDW
ncbi:hypothetical protein FQZ97_953580 [compost metagenome]